MLLYERLTEYGQSDYYGFHMPGHKRNNSIMRNSFPCKIDITEIEGFDDLHHAKEILKDAQEQAAKVYHAEETCYLINGSTSGILSAVLGCTHKDGRILMARNCHKSVYAAVYMNALEPVYIYPEYDTANGLNGAVEADRIREILRTNSIQAVVITSPTYDGVVSDVKAIAEAAHEFGVPLIVDEAHGAHFGFHPYFPENANQRGADVVIHSLHKTLPSLTQTALLHMNGSLINRERIRKYVHMLQTSSPSYVLMASMDECIYFLEKQISGNDEAASDVSAGGRIGNGKTAFDLYSERLEKFRADLGQLECLHIVKTSCYDRSKIVISTRGTAYSGRQLYEELLMTYHLQMEMASREYVLAMTSVCDTEEGFERLKQALFEIDGRMKEVQKKQTRDYKGKFCMRLESKIIEGMETAKGEVSMALPHLERFCTSAQAEILAEQKEQTKLCPVKESAGAVALEYAYVYPPGIPLIVPGERISHEIIKLLYQYMDMGFDIEGLQEEKMIYIYER